MYQWQLGHVVLGKP